MMARFTELPTQSPTTVTDIKNILDLPELENQVNATEGDVQDLETIVADHDTRIISTESGITSLTGRTTAVEADIVGVESRITSIEASIVSINEAIADLSAGGGSGGITLTTVPNIATTLEDTVVTGNVLTNDSTTVGVLRILQYWIDGRVAAVNAGTVTSITAIGDIVIHGDGEWSFTPGLNYSGTVPLIRYMASNGTDTRMSTLMITVTSVDDAPVAGPNAAMTAIDEPVTFGVLGNDFDPEGQTITLTHVNAIAIVVDEPITVPNGTVVVDINNQLTFTPEAEYEGTTTFTYTIEAGGLSTNGTIFIQVGFENIPLFSPFSPIIDGDYFDEQAVNFGNTAMGRVGDAYNNGTGVTEITYTSGFGAFDLGTREPWLYDRPTQIYKLYQRTKDATIRTKALEYAELYMDGVVSTFDLSDFRVGGGVAGDTKYLYPIIANWYEKETGDNRFRAKALGLYNQARVTTPAAYTTSQALWTERNFNYALQACLSQYWLTGNQQALVHANEYFQTLVTMSAATGAPLHPHSQHEGSGITTTITSPWMGALLVETLLQLYRTTGNDAIVTWIARYCDFVLQHGFYINTEVPAFIGLRVPAYLVGAAQVFPDDGGAFGDGEHAFDVANMLMKGIWAKQRLGQSVTAMQEMVNELLVVARAVFMDWTRNTPGLPHYRVNPPRKYGWWFNSAYSKIFFAGVVPLGPINIVLPSVSGNRTVGSIVTADLGVWVGSPVPTLGVGWKRDSVVIAGETQETYILTEDDVGFAVMPFVTATSIGGVVVRDSSNTIITVAVGSPVFTQQPTNSMLPLGDTATFSATVTGSPTPTLQWLLTPKGSVVEEAISGETTDELVLENVTALMSGNKYRLRAINDGDTVYSDYVTLYVTAQLDAVQFTASQGAYLTQALLAPGAANFTIGALIRVDAARIGNRQILTNEFVAGRTVSFGTGNNFPDYNVAIGDSQTGWTGSFFDTQPTVSEWYFVTISADSVLDTGFFTGTIQALSGGATQVVVRDKGIDGLLNHIGFNINGGGAANAGLPITYQYVRAYNTQRTLLQIESDRTSTAAEECLFFWVFEDNGVGGVTVRDASGNNRVPTLVGGTLAIGPTAPIL